MKRARNRLKNWLLQNKLNLFFQKKHLKYFITLQMFFCFSSYIAQTANYVSNGGFEQKYNCNYPNFINIVKNWRTIDSLNFSVTFNNTCYPNIPYGLHGFQWARTGQSYAEASFLCQPPACSIESNRGYFRNRLKSNLISGKIYCVKFYVNITDNSSYGIDSYGAYFGDITLDTITKTQVPLTYLTPQVQNTVSNIITDTMNWIPVTGTFVASGTEKFMVIGNFKSDAATTKTLINTINAPNVYCNVLVDDVSCIPLDLPAYAGPDIWGIPGNTVYIGRPQDVGIDEACQWFKLPNTTSVIATSAGLTLTVTIPTCTYMVKQDICGVIKYDTVIVYASGVGLNQQEIIKNNFNLFPIPAKDELNIGFNFDLDNEFTKIEILNNLGQIIREEEIVFKNKGASVKTNDLPNGVYLLNLKSANSLSVSKRFVIAR
jgi:hypothetical protein